MSHVAAHGALPDKLVDALSGSATALQAAKVRSSTDPPPDVGSEFAAAGFETSMYNEVAIAMAETDDRRRLEGKASYWEVLYNLTNFDLFYDLDNEGVEFVETQLATGLCRGVWDALRYTEVVQAMLRMVAGPAKEIAGYTTVGISVPSSLSLAVQTPWAFVAEGSLDSEYGIALDDDGTEICFKASGWSAGIFAGACLTGLCPGGSSGPGFSIILAKDKTVLKGTDFVVSVSSGVSVGPIAGSAQLSGSWPWDSTLPSFINDQTANGLGAAGAGLLSCDMERMAEGVSRFLNSISPSVYTISAFAKSGVSVKVKGIKGAVGASTTGVPFGTSPCKITPCPCVTSGWPFEAKNCRDFANAPSPPALDTAVDLNLQRCLDLLADTFQAIGQALTRAWDTVIEWANNTARAVVQFAETCIKELAKVGKELGEIVGRAWEAVKDGAAAVVEGVASFFSGRRLSEVTDPKALKLHDLSALMAWFSASSMVSPQSSLNASDNMSTTAPIKLPRLPPRDRLDEYLAALGDTINASESQAYNWGKVSEGSLYLLNRLEAWHTYSEAARALHEQAADHRSIPYQQELSSVRECLAAGTHCEYVDQLGQVIRALKRERLDLLVRAAEAMYAQRRQFSFWSLQPNTVAVQVTPDTTAGQLLTQQAILENAKLALEANAWGNKKQEGWFSFTFDMMDHPLAFERLWRDGTASFQIKRPHADVPKSPKYSFRQLSARVYLLPAPHADQREVVFAKLPFSNFTAQDGAFVTFSHEQDVVKFLYAAEDCTAINQKPSDDISIGGIKISPWGGWTVVPKTTAGAVGSWTPEELARVTSVRFEFKVAWLDGASTLYPGDGVQLRMDSQNLDEERARWCLHAPPAEQRMCIGNVCVSSCFGSWCPGTGGFVALVCGGAALILCLAGVCLYWLCKRKHTRLDFIGRARRHIPGGTQMGQPVAAQSPIFMHASVAGGFAAWQARGASDFSATPPYASAAMASEIPTSPVCGDKLQERLARARQSSSRAAGPSQPTLKLVANPFLERT